MLTGKWTLSNFGKLKGEPVWPFRAIFRVMSFAEPTELLKLTWNPWNGCGRRLPFFHVFDETWRIGWIPLYRIQIGCSWYMFQLKIYSGYTYSILFYDIILKYIKSTFYYLLWFYYIICSFWYYWISYPILAFSRRPWGPKLIGHLHIVPHNTIHLTGYGRIWLMGWLNKHQRHGLKRSRNGSGWG